MAAHEFRPFANQTDMERGNRAPMPRELLLKALVASDDPAADGALATALAESEVALQKVLAEGIVARNKAGSLTALVDLYHVFDQELKTWIVGISDRLYGALRDGSAGDIPQTRLNVIEIITNSRDCRLAYLLTSLLRDRTPRVREAAALGLRRMTGEFLDEMDAWASQLADGTLPDARQAFALRRQLQQRADQRRHLADALAEALGWFDVHHHPSVVEAAMWMVDELKNRFWSAVADRTNHCHRTALELLARSFTPRMVPFAFDGLAHESLRVAILRRLRNSIPSETLNECLRQIWRLQSEPLRSTIRSLKHWPKFEESFEQFREWNDAQQIRAVHLASMMGVPPSRKTHLLLRALQHGGLAGRRAVVWALCESPEAEATAMLHTVAQGADASLGAIARREIRRRRGLAEMQPPADPATRLTDLDRLWRTFEAMSPADQEQQTIEVLARPDNVRSLVQTRLTHPDPADRVKAVRMLTVGRAVAAAEESIYRLAHDPDPKVRSAVMRALPQVPSATAERLLRRATSDSDDRVRANAVEGLEAIGASRGNESLFKSRLGDPDSRTRANAVKVLLKLGARESAESLCAMLRDPDREHRISALWAVSTLHLTPLLTRLKEMAETDPDPLVRQRAQEVLDSLRQASGRPPENRQKEAVPSAS